LYDLFPFLFFFLFSSIELFYFRYFAKLNYPFCESEQSYYDKRHDNEMQLAHITRTWHTDNDLKPRNGALFVYNA